MGGCSLDVDDWRERLERVAILEVATGIGLHWWLVKLTSMCFCGIHSFRTKRE